MKRKQVGRIAEILLRRHLSCTVAAVHGTRCDPLKRPFMKVLLWMPSEERSRVRRPKNSNSKSIRSSYMHRNRNNSSTNSNINSNCTSKDNRTFKINSNSDGTSISLRYRKSIRNCIGSTNSNIFCSSHIHISSTCNSINYSSSITLEAPIEAAAAA